MASTKRLTKIQKAEIETKLNKGIRVKDLAPEYKVTPVTIYNIKKNMTNPLARSSSEVLALEIERDEAELERLGDVAKEIKRLQELIKGKRIILENLEKLEAQDLKPEDTK